MDPTAAPSQQASEPVVVAWSSVWVTLLVSFAVGFLFFCFFISLRRKHQKEGHFELYETRQFTRKDRSPPPFGGNDSIQNGQDNDGEVETAAVPYGMGWLGWAKAAWNVSDEETLRCVGLDSYMYLRFLRMGFRISAVGAALGVVILIPVYATGETSGPDTEEFNSITLAHVEANSPRLWASVLCWLIFVAMVMREFWTEWVNYSPNRSDFLARGDVDTPPDYRYSIMVENVPQEYRSNHRLSDFFDRLFPGKVRQASVCLEADKLEALVAERQKMFEAYEKAQAFTAAKPEKPKPIAKVGAKMGCFGGTKVEAIPYYQEEIANLNAEIDMERDLLHKFADSCNADSASAMESGQGGGKAPDGEEGEESGGHEVVLETVDSKDKDTAKSNEETGSNPAVAVLDGKDEKSYAGRTTSTAFVTFTSIMAKQESVQCELTGKVDYMDAYPAAEPSSIIWKNISMPATRQRIVQMVVALFWTVGVVFWAVPVAFVTSIANLNSILKSFGISEIDPNSFVYGLVSGLLPVIALQVLMLVLYMAIAASATYIIRKKSVPEVDGYTFHWNQLYQFANLWLILIGGSLFNQIDAIIENPGSIAELLASAMPGASTFFVNIVLMGSFLADGLELSMIPTYGINLVMSLIQPEAMRTQRMIDESKKPPSIIWGKQLPPIVFVFLVALVYMPIVPIMEVFTAVYFGGLFLVWKHQCLHVYAQEFEGGGKIWEVLFPFLMASLYTAEVVVIGYMGLKEAIGPTVVSIIPLVSTIIISKLLHRNIIAPLSNLALDVAATVDSREGEMQRSEGGWANSATAANQIYGQPALKTAGEEREPMPYRRED